MTKLKVTQVRSVIHRPKDQKQTVRRLGLHRIRHSVIKDDRPEIRGMISKVQHLVRVEEVPGDGPGDVKDESGGRGRGTARERTSS
ncbi:MAG: 50S ribosomal protein L30 [Actinomycetota bacterium]|jgi:large subunit ribosomal protein L30